MYVEPQYIADLTCRCKRCDILCPVPNTTASFLFREHFNIFAAMCAARKRFPQRTAIRRSTARYTQAREYARRFESRVVS